MQDDVINPNNPQHVEAFHRLVEGYVDTTQTLNKLLTILSHKGFKTFEEAETIIKDNTPE
tara:strand:- start:300 stop:479 length:180 start_codon:yes stop_codon:yes gene_type:complete